MDLKIDSPDGATLSREEAVCALLRSADAMIARAVDLIGGSSGALSGLPVALVLELDGRQLGSDARMLVQTASLLQHMPHLAGAFAGGTVSWSQVRRIVYAVRRLPVAHLPEIDAIVGRHAADLVDADPDRLVQIVEDAAAMLRPDLTLAREDRAVDRSFLAIQGGLDGRARIYGEGDAVSIATIADAIDAKADRPRNPDTHDVSRAQQRFDALLAICEQSLVGGAGNGDSLRPPPRILATIDLAAAATQPDAMRLLWSLPGRPARLTSVTAKMLWCDATIVPIITAGGDPIAVGDASHVVSGKTRTALVARDGGCRFPGCDAPAAYCEPHHVIPGYGNQIEHLVLLCRRCHRRAHRSRWKITLRDAGLIEFTWRGRTYTSHPRHRDPPART